METIHGLNHNGPAIITTGVVFTVLATTAVGLRFTSKRIINSTCGLDDWLLLASLLMYVTVEILVMRSDVIGRRATSPDDGRYLTYLQYVYIYSVFYFPIIALTQASILLFYRHVFFPSHIRYTSVVLAIICIAWCIVALIIEIGYPSHSIGDVFPGSSSVTFDITYLTFWLAMAIIETLIEIVIMILPINEILHLQLSRRRKFLVSLIFALGSFVVITSIIRMAELYRPGLKLFDLSQGDIWFNVHLGTAIISACLPTFSPLRRIFNPRRSSYQKDDTSMLPAGKQQICPLDAHRFMEKIYRAQHNDHQGNFVDARHSGSLSTIDVELQEDGAVESGAAISVRQTVDVV